MLQKTLVTRDEFAALADKIRELAIRLKNIDGRTALKLLEEMKFCACFNNEFRNKTYPELEELYEDLRKRVRKI